MPPPWTLIPHRPVHVRGLHYAAIGTADARRRHLREHREELRVDRGQAGEGRPVARPRAVDGHRRPEERRADSDAVDAAGSPGRSSGSARSRSTCPTTSRRRSTSTTSARVQPYKLVLFAEKSAVGPVVAADRRELQDRPVPRGRRDQRHTPRRRWRGSARRTAGRMVVFTLSDADPAGYWMPCAVAWKLGALRDGWFPELEFEVQPIGFLPEQVHAINANGDPLPSSPLKVGRAACRRMGEDVRDPAGRTRRRRDTQARRAGEDRPATAIKPFYDSSLPRRDTGQRSKRGGPRRRKCSRRSSAPNCSPSSAKGVEDKLDRSRRPGGRDQRPAVDADRRHRPAGDPGHPRPGSERHAVARWRASGMGFGEFLRALKARGAYAKDNGGVS